MKLLLAITAVLTLGVVVPNLYADPILTVNTGATLGALVETPVIGGESWTYTDSVTQASLNPIGLQEADQTFTATYTDIAGVSLLNVTDICADVDVNLAPIACPGLAFTFTNLGLGTPVLLSDASLLGVLGLNLNADAIGVTVDASIGGGSAQIGFNDPPPAATPPRSPRPERYFTDAAFGAMYAPDAASHHHAHDQNHRPDGAGGHGRAHGVTNPTSPAG